MSRNYRNLYAAEEAYPDLYIAVKLYAVSSRLLNSCLRKLPISDDDIQTLMFYSKLAIQRASISNSEIEDVCKNRDMLYNIPYSCGKNVSEADLAACLVAKSLRMKNILASEAEWHKDSVIDFYIYLNLLRQKRRLV